MPSPNDKYEGVTRIPAHVKDEAVKSSIRTVSATVTTATTSLAAVKTAVDAFVVGGVGLNNAQTIALDTQVEQAVTDLAAVATAITACGL